MLSIIQKIIHETSLTRRESWWLLESITQKKKEALLTTTTPLSHEEQKKLHNAIDKINTTSMPLAYIIGNVPFGNLSINIKPPILIPRPETEEWTYQLITTLQPYKNKIKTILDIGTGSGCIALSLAQAFPETQIIATDINDTALQLTKENAYKNNIHNIATIKSNLFENIPTNETFDIIVSNPPYISEKHYPSLKDSVIQWEDHQALFAKNNGLHIIENIVQKAPLFLSKLKLPVKLVLEFDPEQNDNVIHIFNINNFTVNIKKDMYKKNRSAWGFLSK